VGFADHEDDVPDEDQREDQAGPADDPGEQAHGTLADRRPVDRGRLLLRAPRTLSDGVLARLLSGLVRLRGDRRLRHLGGFGTDAATRATLRVLLRVLTHTGSLTRPMSICYVPVTSR